MSDTDKNAGRGSQSAESKTDQPTAATQPASGNKPGQDPTRGGPTGGEHAGHMRGQDKHDHADEHERQRDAAKQSAGEPSATPFHDEQAMSERRAESMPSLPYNVTYPSLTMEEIAGIPRPGDPDPPDPPPETGRKALSAEEQEKAWLAATIGEDEKRAQEDRKRRGIDEPRRQEFQPKHDEKK